MIDRRCLGPGVDASKISPDAEISGASYLTGPRTAVGAGAVVRDSRLHDALVEGGGTIVDSIFVAEGEVGMHRCDAAGRTVVSGAKEPQVAAGGQVSGSTLINTSLGKRAKVTDSWAQDCRLGRDNVIAEAKLTLVNSGAAVRVTGPTEVSETYLGHHATIERRGYFEGLFSNAFRQLRFNESTGLLEVAGTIDLPHISRYGVNTINSTNSGKLLPQPKGILTSFGKYGGLWHDPLLSHEQIELGPCCWVAPWTKVIGQSPARHETDEELVNDWMMTYIMPFAVAGVGGDATRGLVMPGELSNGLGPKQRRGAWAFTYAPGMVIDMVRRLHEALDADRKYVADTIVVEALKTAIEMTRAMAAGNKVDLAVSATDQRPGWPRWIATTYALLRAHLDARLWKFEDGRPSQWRQSDGRWTHPRIDSLLALAPDALENQLQEDEVFTAEDPIPKAQVAVPAGATVGTGGEAEVDPSAEVAVDAVIGPGCRIGPGTIIEAGAQIWNSTLAGCKVASGARVERSIVTGGEIGRGSVVRSCRMTEVKLGENSSAVTAIVNESRLAPQTTVSAFANVSKVETAMGTILGEAISSAKIDTYLMSMHTAGTCSHLEALPMAVELDGQAVQVPAVIMIGAGSLIRGTQARCVRMECCFLGSNAIVEANTYVGFGCFILGTLGPNAGLLPLTVSTGGGPSRHQIGGVLGSLASTIITHFINWTFQSVGPQGAAAVAEMTRQSIQRGIDAVQWELARRTGQAAAGGESYACYSSLSDYSEQQLKAGLAKYRRSLESGAWEIAFDGERLRFTSPKGCWLERNGNAFWKGKRYESLDR